MDQIRDQLKGISVPAAVVVVMDLFGNNSFRWEEEDGTPVMPVRDGGTYHMNGQVTVCTDDTVKKLLNIVMPVINDAAPLGKIFILPLQRYVFGGCCSNVEHFPNVKKPRSCRQFAEESRPSQSNAEGGARQKGSHETLGNSGVERPLGR